MNHSTHPPSPGYWQASDGNWYPPEQHPSTQTYGNQVLLPGIEYRIRPKTPWWRYVIYVWAGFWALFMIVVLIGLAAGG